MGEKAFVINPSLRQYCGKALDMGEVFELQGVPNDELLLKHGYVRRFSEGSEPKMCDCGRIFAHDAGLTEHRKYSHAGFSAPQGALEPEGAPPPPPLEQMIPPKRRDFRRVEQPAVLEEI